MSEGRVTVFVVLDPDFGERLSELAVQGPLWLTSSPVNEAAVKKHWKTVSSGYSVTYWSEPRSGATGEEWLGILDDLEVHHSESWSGPGIAGIQVIGVPLTKEAESALHEFEYTVTSSEPDGFAAIKTAAPQESTTAVET